MSPQLGLSPETLAEREAANGLRQIDRAVDIIYDFLEPERPFFLTPSLILHLQMIAVDGIRDDGGQWRTGDAVISGSRHIPPRAHLVPLLMQEMCDFINDNFHEKTAFWLSAFVMRRLNWIHPFADGNGRTARTLSYILLCVKVGYVLKAYPVVPGSVSGDGWAGSDGGAPS